MLENIVDEISNFVRSEDIPLEIQHMVENAITTTITTCYLPLRFRKFFDPIYLVKYFPYKPLHTNLTYVPLVSQKSQQSQFKNPSGKKAIDIIDDMVLRQSNLSANCISMKDKPTTSLMFVWFANYFIHLFIKTDKNDVTKSCIDGFDVSMIYGDDSDRILKHGKMKLDDGFAPTVDYLNGTHFDKKSFPRFMNTHIGHIIIHTLILREHNRFCDILLKKYPSYSDERLFELAQSNVVNILLHIVRTEYISTIVGHLTNSSAYGLNLTTVTLIDVFMKSGVVSPEYVLSYVWHSAIPENLFISDKHTINTRDSFQNIYPSIDTFESREQCFESVLRYGLETPSGNIFTLNSVPTWMRHVELAVYDLQAKNSICSLNDIRRQLSLAAYESFEELSADEQTLDKMKRHFASVEDVDLYTGMLIESSSTSYMFGETQATILTVFSFGSVPKIHGELQESVISEEYEIYKKNGFLTQFINNNSNFNIDKRIDYFEPIKIK